MAEEHNNDSVLGGLRSLLPKFFAENDDGESEIESPLPPAPPIASPAPSAPMKTMPRTPSQSTQSEPQAAPPADESVDDVAAPPDLPHSGNGVAMAGGDVSIEQAHLQHMQYLIEEFGQVQSEMQRMYQLVEVIAERESAQEKVFNTLHAELRDYKNDFIYEHFKPVVRPLLFLYDALEQFDAEIALYERPNTGERRQVGLSPQLVRENIAFFRDQLVEALRICEVTPMETPKGPFNAKLHKVIDVVPVEADQDGMIQRLVRSGWYLNGALLRSAEVIVGKKMA
jgi:molecular chaperone GrpE (heat shock protein)